MGALAFAVYVLAKLAGQRRDGNGRSDGEHTGELRKDLAAMPLSTPPGGYEMVTKETFDTTISGIHKRIDFLQSESGGVRERVAKVEQTCDRTEKKVDAIPGTVAMQLKAQTVEISNHLSQELFRAVRGVADEIASETDVKIAAALKPQEPVS